MSKADTPLSLVTGGQGFVGQRLVRGLVAEGFRVRLLSRSIRDDMDTVVCDLGTDPIPVDTCKAVNIVYHLAAHTHDLRDASKLEDAYRSLNVDATMRLAEAAARAGVQRFVFISSVKAGGLSGDELRTGEREAPQPDGVYGRTKREAELKLLAFGESSGMEVTVVRPCLVYGPGVKGNLRSMLNGIEQGWLPPLPEVHNRRSLIHVDDLVRALLFLTDHADADGQIFIATGGRDYSTHDIYKTLCEVAGKPLPRWVVPRFVFDIAARLHPRIAEKVSKLFGDAQYSSAKLESLGFKAHRDLREIHETNY